MEERWCENVAGMQEMLGVGMDKGVSTSDMKRGAPTPLERLETLSCLCLTHTRTPRCTPGDSPVQEAVALLWCATDEPLPWQVDFLATNGLRSCSTWPTQDGASPMDPVHNDRTAQ